MAAITWYTMTPELNVQERGPIDLVAALAAVDQYVARLKATYDSGEEAIAQTMFGFSRAPNDFIEICLHGPRQISVTVELPPPPTGGLFAKLRGPFRRERTFDSADALKRHVAAYFTLTPEEFKVHCRTDSG